MTRITDIIVPTIKRLLSNFQLSRQFPGGCEGRSDEGVSPLGSEGDNTAPEGDHADEGDLPVPEEGQTHPSPASDGGRGPGESGAGIGSRGCQIFRVSSPGGAAAAAASDSL